MITKIFAFFSKYWKWILAAIVVVFSLITLSRFSEYALIVFRDAERVKVIVK